jgi:hypothetical protein
MENFIYKEVEKNSLELWQAQVNETVEFQLSAQPGVGFGNSEDALMPSTTNCTENFVKNLADEEQNYGWKILTRLVHVTYSPRKVTNF